MPSALFGTSQFEVHLSSASKGAGSKFNPNKETGTAGKLGQIAPASSETISSPRCFTNLNVAWLLALAPPTPSSSSPACVQQVCRSERSLRVFLP